VISTQVVAGKFYPNVQNPRARPSMARAILKAEGHEDAARRSRRRDRAPANQFFKGKREDDAVVVQRVPFDRLYAKRFPQGVNLKKLHAQTDHFNEYEEDDGDPPPVYNDASNAPRIVGLDQCAAFRAATTGKRRPAPAGLFNTGTNFLMSLLRMNCILPRECAGRGIPAEKQPDGFPYFTMDNIVNDRRPCLSPPPRRRKHAGQRGLALRLPADAQRVLRAPFISSALGQAQSSWMA